MTESLGRICLAGCGAMGRTHVNIARNVPDRLRYAAFFDAAPGRASAFAAEHGVEGRVFEHWEDVLTDAEIDAVDICAPHSLHAAMTLEALSAGKHVFLEKPMALSAADCDRMIAAARERGLLLSVMHNRRFGRAALAMKAMLDTGDLGDPVVITAHGIEGPRTVGVRSWLSQASEGGVGMAQTVHFAYMLRWLFGDVSEVSCLTSRKGIAWMEGEVTAAFLLRFASGAIGQITSTFAQEAGRHEHRITIYGGSGQATFAGARLDVCSPRRYGNADWQSEQFEPGFPSEMTEPLASFGEAIRGRGLPAVSPEEGREAVALIEAAYQSAREGRTVPLVPLTDSAAAG